MSETKEKKVRARPVKFSKELGSMICERVSNGEATIKICKEEGMPAVGTWFRWLESNEELREQYARAKQNLAHIWAEESVTISDNATPIDGRVDKQKLQVDARKWIVSKLLPKVYSEKHIAEITGKDGGPVKTELAIGLKEIHEAIMAEDEARTRGNGDK